MSIEEKIIAAVQEGVKTLYGTEVPAEQVQLQKTKKEFEDCISEHKMTPTEYLDI